MVKPILSQDRNTRFLFKAPVLRNFGKFGKSSKKYEYPDLPVPTYIFGTKLPVATPWRFPRLISQAFGHQPQGGKQALRGRVRRIHRDREVIHVT